jgi:hypothetical protein
LPIIVTIIKPRRIRWAGYIACTGAKWSECRVFVRKPEGERDH